MSLHPPYFFIKEGTDTPFQVCHNCNGGVDFMVTSNLDEKTKYLVEMAIAEGERRRAKKLRDLLEIK